MSQAWGSTKRERSAHRLDEDNTMELVDSVPRCTNSEGYIGSLSLKERAVDVGLKFSGSW